MTKQNGRRLERIEGIIGGLGVAVQLTLSGDVFEADDGSRYTLGELGDLLLRNRAVVLYRDSSSRIDLDKIFRLGPEAYEQMIRKYVSDLEKVYGDLEVDDGDEV